MKILLFLISTLTFAQPVIIDPIGDDDWKTVVFETQLKDQVSLPDYKDNGSYACPTTAVLVVENSYKKINLNKRFNRVFKKSIPAQGVDDFKFTIRIKDEDFEIHNGRIDNGTVHLKSVLRRVEINDMLVTREDGSTYTAKGKVRVLASKYLEDRSGPAQRWRTLCQFSTSHGITLPEGFIYKVNVEAQTEDGIDKYSKTIKL